MPSPIDITAAIGKIAMGRHWKSTTTGYIIAAVILAYYFLAEWKPGTPIDFNWILVAATAAAGGRISPDPAKRRPTLRVQSPRDRQPPTDPSGTTGGSMPWILLIAAGLFGLALCIAMTGCTSTSGGLDRINGGFDAQDGKVLGVIPDATAAAALDKVGLSGFRKFSDQLEDMRKLYSAVPAGTAIDVAVRRKSTGELLPFDDLEMTANMAWRSDIRLPVPDAGSRATVRYVSPVPPPAPTTTAPAVIPPPDTGGGTTTQTMQTLSGPAVGSVVAP